MTWVPAEGLLDRDPEWRHAVEVGTPPFHRLGNPAFAPLKRRSGPGGLAAWREAVSRLVAGRDVVALSVLGVDEASADAAFGEVELNSAAPQPRWLNHLTQLVGAIPVESLGHELGTDDVAASGDYFLEGARQILGWEQLIARYPFLDESALAAMARHLAVRVVMTCGAVLELESVSQQDAAWDFTRSAWRQRLLGFPALNYAVGIAARQWHDSSMELLVRLGADLDLLTERCFSGRAPGPLVDIEFDLGDRHRDGRSVARLCFASGATVMYKPKDPTPALLFAQVAGLIEEVAGVNLVPTVRVLGRQGYSWEDYVPQHAVDSKAEIAAFFTRFGATLRTLQLLEGRDFWIDNLRADGDRPVFIDLECILQPRVPGTGFEPSHGNLPPHMYEESVLPTGAVTMPMSVADAGRQDFGGLAGPGTRALPLGLWSGYHDRDNGPIQLRGGRLFWTPNVAWPSIEGRPAAAIDHLDPLERGYRTCQDVLLQLMPTLSDPQGFLSTARSARVRALMRSTWEYLMLLRASLAPDALLDGVTREVALAQALATAPEWGNQTDERTRVAVAWSEVDGIRNLDVPEFFSSPAHSRVLDADGKTLGTLFAGTAHDRLTARLRDLQDFDVDGHLGILQYGVAAITTLTGTNW